MFLISGSLQIKTLQGFSKLSGKTGGDMKQVLGKLMTGAVRLSKVKS